MLCCHRAIRAKLFVHRTRQTLRGPECPVHASPFSGRGKNPFGHSTGGTQAVDRRRYRRIPSTETFFILVLQVHQPCSVPIGKHAHCLIAAIGPHLKKPRIAVLQHGSSKFCSIRNRRHNPVDGDVAPHCACLLANYCGNPVAAIDVDVSKHAIGGLG